MGNQEMFGLEKEQITALILSAADARKKAYAPYSHYLVGAAILGSEPSRGDGAADATNQLIMTQGMNIENASYGATICAERVALFRAVAEGQRSFVAIALVAGPATCNIDGTSEIADAGLAYPSPCGICRQALREFVDPKKFLVIMAKSTKDYRVKTLEELLPDSFGPEALE